VSRLTAGQRRRNGAILVTGLVIFVALIATIPFLLAAEDAQRPPAEHIPTTLVLPSGMTIADLEVASVEGVIDGDTADVRLNGRLYRVRYYGVDTPERGERCFREATDRNQQLVHVGDKIYLLKDAREFDPNNRLLRYVFLADGTSLDATLVIEGYGEAWRQDGQYRQQLIAMQQQAEAADRGCLWADEGTQ